MSKNTIYWTIVKNSMILVAGSFTAYAGVFTCSYQPEFYDWIVLPIMHRINPEWAHKISIKTLKNIFLAPTVDNESFVLQNRIQHLIFPNPIGLAAGFDKNGEALSSLILLGFGFVEIGSITPEPQPGNEKPRVFRLKEDKAIINRYGFNNWGMKKIYKMVKYQVMNHHADGVIGVNLGVNKNSEDPILDYVRGIRRFGEIASYYVINVSSPNTPGLRDLQHKEQLEKVLQVTLKTRNELTAHPKPLLFLKLSPDLTKEEQEDIAKIVTHPNYRIDGLVISNTTVERNPDLKNEFKSEAGGLSGAPLKKKSTEMIAEMYKLTKGTIPIIGVGGIFTGEDAFEKIKAGACLIQIYTSFIYHGPHVIAKIKAELEECLRRENFNKLEDAVGAGVQL